MALVARLIRMAAGLIAAFLVAGILLYVLEANESNGVVNAVMDVGRFFADPFNTMFELDDNKVQIAINWGIAAAVYLIVGSVIARLLLRVRAPRLRARRST